MELDQVHRIIKFLSDGINPFTGEVFAQDHIVQNADVARALCAAEQIIRLKVTSQEERKRKLPPNAGKPWTDEETEQLEREFEANANLYDIAEKHGRTPNSIHERLLKLRKIQY